jgi:hypothetical protein
VKATELALRIVVERPPAGVDYALQRGHGKDYETVDKQRASGSDLRFDFTVGVKPGRGVPVLLGPFVQGTPAERFVYLDIGTYAGQTDTPWSRRLKVPLRGITRALIDSGAVLEARVRGTAADGSPCCATPKPFAGWKPMR